MKKIFSLNKLLHNDKLMMIVSVILAIIIWALIVYGPSNMEERVITGVPVSITLNDYAKDTLNLRITEGADATATVRVYGLRSVISALTPQDITVTADTGNVISDGTFTLPLQAVSEGNYSITSVVGNNGTDDTVTITCDSWKEISWSVDVEMPNLTVKDTAKQQFGNPSVSGAAITDGTVVVVGPQSVVNRIRSVTALVEESASIDETTVYEANLQARDADGKMIDGVSFQKAEDGKVSVTVPVLVYRKVSLKAEIVNVPSGYASQEKLVSVSPSTIELWGVPAALDNYVAAVKEQIRVNFDNLSKDDLTRTVTLEPAEGVRPVSGSESVKVKVNLTGISSRKISLTINKSNFTVSNCPKGFTVKPSETKVSSIVLYGPKSAISKVTAADIRAVMDMNNTATAGQQTGKVRLTVKGQKKVWFYYGPDTSGIDVLVSVTEK